MTRPIRSSALVNHNLVRQQEDERGDVRFDVLHVIREYAVDLFESSPESDDVRDRHARYYVSLAEAETADESGDETLLGEYDNLGSALDWLLDRSALGDGDAAELGLRLANKLGRLWYRHGHLEDGVMLLQRALAVASDADERQRATALRHLGTPAGNPTRRQRRPHLLRRSAGHLPIARRPDR